MSGGNPISAVTDAFSSALGTDGSHGGLLGIGAQLDKSVRTVIPGGWATIGLAALAIAAPYAAPELFAAAAPSSIGMTAAGTGASAGMTAGGVGASGGILGGAASTAAGITATQAAAGLGLGAAASAGNAALSAAGTGSLYGGAMGGVNSAIKGTDPLQGILAGAIMGGLTGASMYDVSSLLAANGVPQSMIQPMSSALVGAAKSIAGGADPLTVLENTALSSGLNQLSSAAKSLISPDIGTTASNIATSAGTGALGSAIKGGDVGTGALSGAINSAAGQTVGAIKSGLTDAYNTLTAPSASAAPSDPNAYGPISPVQTGDPTALQSQYLTAQAQQLLEQGQALQPTLSQQQAELATAGSKANEMYTQAVSDKSALDAAIKSTYDPAYANVADLQGKAASMYSQVEALQKTYDDNKAAYIADSTNKTAFNAANDAANQLNTLIPQYNTAAQTFTTANTALENLYTAQIAPLVQTYQASNSALGDQMKTYTADQNTLQNTSNQYSTIVNGLNTISTGNLVSGMNAPVVSMQAPSATADSYYNQLVNAMSNPDAPPTTGSQTAGVTVEFPTMTDAGNGTNTPYVPTQAPTTPAVEDPSQTIVDRKVNPDGTITETMADGSTVVSDATTGAIISPTTPSVNPDQAVQDQLLADAAANQQGTVGGTTGGTASVTPTPVDTGALPVTPTPVDTGALPVTPTPVDTGALPVTPTPVDTGALPVTPTPVDTGALPVTPTPSTTDLANLPVASPATGGGTAPANGGLPTDTGIATTGGSGLPMDTGTATTTTSGGGLPTDTGTATTGSGTGTTGSGTGTTGSGTGTTAADAAAVAAIVAALTGGGGTATTGSTSTGTGSTSTGTGGTSTGTYNTTPASGLSATTLATPKATLVKGTQIASPLGSFNIPTVDYGTPAVNPNSLAEIQNAAQGGIMHLADGGSTEGELPMKPSLIKGKQVQHANLFGLSEIPLYKVPSFDKTSTFAQGGSVPEGHNPQFYSEGGLGSMQNKYVQGPGTGTSDSIPAMLSNGEFVIPADVVSSLGDGSNDGGAKVLDALLKTIRAHKQKHDSKHLPPDSKGALGYLLEAKRKVRS